MYNFSVPMIDYEGCTCTIQTIDDSKAYCEGLGTKLHFMQLEINTGTIFFAPKPD